MEMKQILQEYKDYLIKLNKAHDTINTYIRNVNGFLKWLKDRYGESESTGITSLDIREYQSYMLNIKKYKPSGIKQRMYSIISYCDFLYKKGYIKLNLTEDIKVIKVQKNKTAPEIISKNEVNLFRREVYKSGNLRDIAIVEMLLGTGMRISELANLEVDDIEISERKGCVRIREGKGSKYRIVPLNKDIRNALKKYLEVKTKDYGASLWLGQRGALTNDGIRKMLKRYAKRVNLEDKIYPHIFRHYLAHRLLRVKNKDPVLVAEILGHSDINTLIIYTQPTFEEKAEVLENVNF